MNVSLGFSIKSLENDPFILFLSAIIHEPAVLIEGVLFRARYLGSHQMTSDGRATKASRMAQAQEAVAQVKVSAPSCFCLIRWIAGAGWRQAAEHGDRSVHLDGEDHGPLHGADGTCLPPVRLVHDTRASSRQLLGLEKTADSKLVSPLTNFDSRFLFLINVRLVLNFG